MYLRDGLRQKLQIKFSNANVSQGRIETEFADQILYLALSEYTDTGSTNPRANLITPGAWQSSHWRVKFKVTGMIRPGKKTRCRRKLNPWSAALEVDILTTGPTRRPKETETTERLFVCWLVA